MLDAAQARYHPDERDDVQLFQFDLQREPSS
jgi:hypothetical protein